MARRGGEETFIDPSLLEAVKELSKIYCLRVKLRCLVSSVCIRVRVYARMCVNKYVCVYVCVLICVCFDISTVKTVRKFPINSLNIIRYSDPALSTVPLSVISFTRGQLQI